MAFKFGSTTPAAQPFSTSSIFASTTTAQSSVPSLFSASTAAQPSAAPSIFSSSTTSTGQTATTNSFTFGISSTTPSGLKGFPTLGTGTSAFNTLGGFSTTSTGATNAFGTTLAGTSLFGHTQTQQQQQQQQQANVANQLDNLAKAVMMPHIFNDERDAIIAKWNQLQAYWGTGRAYFDSNGFVDLTSENLLCRFKAISYSCNPQTKDEDGLVGLVLKKPYSEVLINQKLFVDTVYQILGGKPSYSVCVKGVKPWPDNKTEIVIYIEERQMTGQKRCFPTSKVVEHLNEVTTKKRLSENPLNVEHILSKQALTPEQLKQYLDNPLAGIDPLLWQQAKKDNPDPDNFIPVPIVGFDELLQRLKQQEQQTKNHQNRLDLIAQELNELQLKHRNTVARMDEAKRKHLNLGHRLLKVIVKQEVYRKLGVAMQDTEEQFRAQLEALQSELNHPTQFKVNYCQLTSINMHFFLLLLIGFDPTISF
ncbi:nuclear pore complex protein Nup54 [Octopus bimaculoides]|uniref:nuclear pore complex protein Nup54 n=1 Tax=Octopus bimaculoides TaxID=37653 RepID=UPI0022E987EB|nr:nuclear pore complex protein Nup54 [Octopus bimaculoides]